METSFEDWLKSEGYIINSRLGDPDEPDYYLAKKAFEAGWNKCVE